MPRKIMLSPDIGVYEFVTFNELVERAQEWLEGKQFTKARYVTQAMNMMSCSQARYVLERLGWRKINSHTWERPEAHERRL